MVSLAKNGEAGRLFAPRYSFAEADHLAGARRGTTRRWLLGYSDDAEDKRVRLPPLTSNASTLQGVSFVDLVEIAAVSRLGDHGFTILQLRQLVRSSQEALGVERPLARWQFKTSGRGLFVELGSAQLEIGPARAQRAWDEALEPFLDNLDYADDLGLAQRWWPQGRDTPIVIDPDYGFGLPVIAGSGVRTEIIAERARANDTAEQIARDFQVTPDEVKQALQFETKLMERLFTVTPRPFIFAVDKDGHFHPAPLPPSATTDRPPDQ